MLCSAVLLIPQMKIHQMHTSGVILQDLGYAFCISFCGRTSCGNVDVSAKALRTCFNYLKANE
jgi:hypothetical protein